MHPIEQLRHVARSRGVAAAPLAYDAASALAGLRADHANLVVACRRIVERHPEIGQLWWLCSRLLVAAEPTSEAWELAELLADDPVGRVLARDIPAGATVVTVGNPGVIGDALIGRDDLRVWCIDSEYGAGDLMRRLDRYEVPCETVPVDAVGRAVAGADVVLLEAAAGSSARVLAPVGTQVVAVVARAAGTPVWLVAGTGTRLPSQFVDEIAKRVLVDGWNGSIDDLPLDLIDIVVSDEGRSAVPGSALRADCPFAPELLRPGIT